MSDKQPDISGNGPTSDGSEAVSGQSLQGVVRPRKRRLVVGLVAVLLLALIALIAAAGSSGGDSAAVSLSRDRASGAAATSTTVAAASTNTTFAAEASAGSTARRDSTGLETGVVAPVAFQVGSIGRDVIFTADLNVAVTDVAVATDTATRKISTLGGFLFGERTTGAPNPASVLTFKVFPDDFQEALDRLGSLGEVRTKNRSADDVTERIVDLRSRILSVEASVERLRELMGSAGGVKIVVQVETELVARETQLETLRGQLRTLEDHVSLATIVLTLTEALNQPRVELMVTAYVGHDGIGASCPGRTDLAIEEGSNATVCFEILNVGDTPLTNFELNDPVLDLSLEDLIVVFGDPAGTIEPGETIMVAAEIVAERDLRTQTRLSAVPVNQDGQPLAGRSVANTTTIFLNVVDPGGVASFNEGLSASLGSLANLGRVLILALGVALPFIWLVPLLGWLYVRWRRERHEFEHPEGVPLTG